jgi:dTDP-4-dehydrorhamnose reductase
MYVITGGSGLLGNAFKDILPNEKYPNRKMLDLTNRKMVFDFFSFFHYYIF